MPSLRCVLDANVLWPMVLRDTLLRLATPDLGLYEPIWSDQILSEMTRTVLAAGRSSADRLSGTVRLMNEVFPDSSVNPAQAVVKGLALPDPDDIHVVAAAVASEAQFILTLNISDFPADSITPFSLEILTPDQFLIALYRSSPDDVLLTLARQVANYRQAPTTFEELLHSLARCGVPEFAYTVGEENDIRELELIVDEYRRSGEEDE